MTFQILAESLTLPTEAFYVTVDGDVKLSQSDTARTTSAGDWVEYSVPVGKDNKEVTWTHVYNPFELESLPEGDGNDVGLWMDDLRYIPYTTEDDIGQMEMTNDGDGGKWKTEGDGTRVVASTDDIKGSDGYADISFIMATHNGGTLKYKVKTSTSAPHDDHAVLFNGREADAMFGEMAGFDENVIEVPHGKQLVTLRHRKNPGGFSESLLGGLGNVPTDGMTWLKDLSFEAS